MGWGNRDRDLDSRLAEAERARDAGEISDAAYHMRVERAIDEAPPPSTSNDTTSRD